MNKHTALYVDVGYREATQIVLIQSDLIRENISLKPGSEFGEIVEKVVDILRTYELSPTKLKCGYYPALEKEVMNRLNRLEYKRRL